MIGAFNFVGSKPEFDIKLLWPNKFEFTIKKIIRNKFKIFTSQWGFNRVIPKVVSDFFNIETRFDCYNSSRYKNYSEDINCDKHN